MAIAMLAMLGMQVAMMGAKAGAHASQQKQNERMRNEILKKEEPILKEITQIGKDISASSHAQQKSIGDLIEQGQKEATSIQKMTFAEYQENMHKQGFSSQREYIDQQEHIMREQAYKKMQFAQKEAFKTFKSKRSKQELANMQDSNRVEKLIATRGLEGSTIEDQTMAQEKAQETQKIAAIAQEFNASYQAAVQQNIKQQQDMVRQFSMQRQKASVADYNAFMTFKNSEIQTQLAILNNEIKQKTNSYEQRIIDLKFASLQAENKLSQLSMQMQTI